MWDKSDKSEYDISRDERTAVYHYTRGGNDTGAGCGISPISPNMI